MQELRLIGLGRPAPKISASASLTLTCWKALSLHNGMDAMSSCVSQALPCANCDVLSGLCYEFERPHRAATA